jgi:hypothetical protein
LRQGYPNLDVNVTDNFSPDRDSKVGEMFVAVSGAGWYTVCQTDAPSSDLRSRGWNG